MPRRASIGILSLLAVLLMGCVAFSLYYFGVWPKPSLTVDDPAISEWLQNGDVVIHPRGFNRDPLGPHLYLDPGESVGEGCQWHTHLSLQGGDPGPRIARTLATNYGTCERLVIEGVSPR